MTVTDTEMRPHDDIDNEWVTEDQLKARIAYCEEQAAKRDPYVDCPDEWANQYAARALYLTGQLENFHDYDKDEQGRVLIDERDYVFMLESLLEDYAYRDIYENGDGEGGYAWMLWAYAHEARDFHCALNAWRLEKGLEPPNWVGDNLCYYEEEED